ncbi:aromatic amino acid ammonia-lyase [Moorena sp. SIO4E2]|uniref:HAL/PAL/TAL family ammonia-lyase n=1 Tax=Moorena sp. SIO4E2 TaxID=2607826 RepID=UPI00257B3F45|nr:aromatic amino acid ammonia-lyase [Moorena sp. SIO4E2]
MIIISFCEATVMKWGIFESNSDRSVTLGARHLSIEDVVSVARYGAQTHLSQNPKIWQGVQASVDYISEALAANEPIYGVTTGFGGMANTVISPEKATELQNNILWYHKAGAGKRLPSEAVRAAMLLRINSHLHGASGIRRELIERMQIFLNAGVTPYVYELGSIGASGDITPLTDITGALVGVDPAFKVDFNGEEMSSVEALKRLNLPRLSLEPKEGLAMVNGTSVMTGMAALCVSEAQVLLALAMGTHALLIQGLGGTNQSFHPFIHALKPHKGQIWAAAEMLQLLSGSSLIRDELSGGASHQGNAPIQDRYSLRCLPQYLGPIVDGLKEITEQIEVEINSVTDNPLIDTEGHTSYHGGNFLGQYVGMAMDRLRHVLGLTAKHLDAQIALVVAPEFSNGLSPSLVGNSANLVNMGLKALQITGNSIMPLLTFYGNSLVDRFPTHAEQFNQNINSQGFGSTNLTRQSLELFEQYMAVSLMFGVQAVDLRTSIVAGHYDARECLSPETVPLYEAVREVVGRPPSFERPYIWNDCEQFLDMHIARLANDLTSGGRLARAANNILSRLKG